jgi:integrase
MLAAGRDPIEDRRAAVAAQRAAVLPRQFAAVAEDLIASRWQEIDFAAARCTVPADRMKGGKPHRVPLSPAALAVLERLPLGAPRDLVFPGARRGRPLSDMAGTVLLRRMGCGGVTVHGFRSTFRDWAGEATPHACEVCETALSHPVGDVG